MNSEELELSLRTEFESYLKGYLAELRQEVSEFQKNFETEFEKHKSQTDEAVRRLVQRFDGDVAFSQAFNESVVEHLRLARDEGATITALAIGEAEKLKQETPAAEYDKLRDAINEISSKTSQSEILKSLVDHASSFAPRGAFFIVKNDHFVGWRAFGSEAAVSEAAMREIQFAMSSDTLLARSVETLVTTAAGAGANQENGLFLDALGFGSPDRMYAIPLVARGRGVAVLYADFGTEGVALNPEALETLVRVAGLTVELAAAGVQPAPVAAPAFVESPQPEAAPFQEPAVEESVEEKAYQVEEERHVEEAPAAAVEPQVNEELHTPAFHDTFRQHEQFQEAPVYEEVAAPVQEVTEFETVGSYDETPAAFVEEPVAEETSVKHVEETFVSEVIHEPIPEVEPEAVHVERFGEVVVEEVEEVTYFEPVEEVTEAAIVEPEVVNEYAHAEPVHDEFPEVLEEPVVEPEPEPVSRFEQFEAEPVSRFEPAFEAAPEPVSRFEPQVETVPEPVTRFEPQVETVQSVSAPVVSEPVAEAASSQARTKYRDRNVDLPIEVPEDERRLHNDARRFARLLVSEIKLYNEQKVADGRQSGDLYDRLREAIDRSRDMYDKRVQQPVAEKFDYFHFELVNSLAEGQDVKLGASYPGGKVAA